MGCTSYRSACVIVGKCNCELCWAIFKPRNILNTRILMRFERFSLKLTTIII